MKSNNKIKYVVYQKQIYSFYYKIPTSPSLLQNRVFKNKNSFPRTPIFRQSPSHHQHDSKPNKNSKFKSPMSNDQSLSLMPCSSKTMKLTYPLNTKVHNMFKTKLASYNITTPKPFKPDNVPINVMVVVIIRSQILE
jgi:hypothetical protein